MLFPRYHYTWDYSVDRLTIWTVSLWCTVLICGIMWSAFEAFVGLFFDFLQHQKQEKK